MIPISPLPPLLIYDKFLHHNKIQFARRQVSRRRHIRSFVSSVFRHATQFICTRMQYSGCAHPQYSSKYKIPYQVR